MAQNLEDMSLDELKEYAKSIGLTFGKIGKEKLIARIEEKQSENEAINSVMNDDDLTSPDQSETKQVREKIDGSSLVDSISAVIDDLDESSEEHGDEVVENIPIDTVIPVKSITFGGLTYKSRVNNAIFRWNQIGDIQYMTMADLNEMNNYKRAYLNEPLVILLDDRAVKKFRLTDTYKKVAKIGNLKEVYSSDMATISNMVDTALEVNMRDLLISKTRQMIKNKSLVDINVIKLLSRKLSYDFEEIFEQVN